jgi:hypothetical protein
VNVTARGSTVNSEPNASFGKCPATDEKRESANVIPAQQGDFILRMHAPLIKGKAFFFEAIYRCYFVIRDRIMKDKIIKPMTISRKRIPY